MKLSKTTFYSSFFALLGAAGVLLYRRAFAVSTDEMELLVRGSLPEILLWVLAACACVGAVVLTRKCTVGDPTPAAGILGNLVYIAGIFTLLREPVNGPEMLTLLFRGAACLTMVCLAVSAVFYAMRKRPHFLLELAPMLLAFLLLVECYQLWSERPLILHYFFGLGAVLSLLLFSYHRLERSSGLPFKAMYPIAGLLGAFFCLAAVPQGDFSLFFAAAGLWIAAEMTSLTEGA